MREGRFFRRKLRWHSGANQLRPWQGEVHDTLHRMQLQGRELRSDVARLTRQYPAATLFFAGAATGLLLWALLRRSRPAAYRPEGMDHW